MKKAVIISGSRQYIVSEGDSLLVDKTTEKNLVFEPLLVFDDDGSDEKSIKIGQPTVSNVKVSAKVVDELVKADKVTAIRYKSKKRVKKIRGHRQQHSRIEITSIK